MTNFIKLQVIDSSSYQDRLETQLAAISLYFDTIFTAAEMFKFATDSYKDGSRPILLAVLRQQAG